MPMRASGHPRAAGIGKLSAGALDLRTCGERLESEEPADVRLSASLGSFLSFPPMSPCPCLPVTVFSWYLFPLWSFYSSSPLLGVLWIGRRGGVGLGWFPYGRWVCNVQWLVRENPAGAVALSICMKW